MAALIETARYFSFSSTSSRASRLGPSTITARDSPNCTLAQNRDVLAFQLRDPPVEIADREGEMIDRLPSGGDERTIARPRVPEQGDVPVGARARSGAPRALLHGRRPAGFARRDLAGRLGWGRGFTARRRGVCCQMLLVPQLGANGIVLPHVDLAEPPVSPARSNPSTDRPSGPLDVR